MSRLELWNRSSEMLASIFLSSLPNRMDLSSAAMWPVCSRQSVSPVAWTSGASSLTDHPGASKPCLLHITTTHLSPCLTWCALYHHRGNNEDTWRSWKFQNCGTAVGLFDIFGFGTYSNGIQRGLSLPEFSQDWPLGLLRGGGTSTSAHQFGPYGTTFKTSFGSCLGQNGKQHKEDS